MATGAEAFLELFIELIKTTWSLGALIGEMITTALNFGTSQFGVTIPPVVGGIITQAVAIIALAWAVKKNVHWFATLLIILVVVLASGGIIKFFFPGFFK